MDIKKISAAVLCTSFALSASAAHAQVWTKIEDPNQVRQLISEKTMDGKYWKYYFRSDGKLAYAQGGFTSFRGWKINDDGAICMNIYGMPDKVIECQVLLGTGGEPAQYMLEHPRGKSAVAITDPDQSLIDALVQKAGPTK